ncbi:hypothetical protein BJV82DRAFT_606598 [Fennellomyces sp. T-0311]|nr:hypothetical protein BJV82DRAFT_606598 [Fennellomyces sp. T-0311]
MEKEDDSYMAMLNSNIINPGRQPTPAPKKPLPASLNTATPFPALMEAYHAITEISKSVSLVSESDEPFEWITADWSAKELPSAEQMVELGFADTSTPCRTKGLAEFFGPMITDDDPYGQAESLRTLHKRLEEAYGDKPRKVYLVGEREITVLVVGIVDQTDNHAQAIAGLRSLLVQT